MSKFKYFAALLLMVAPTIAVAETVNVKGDKTDYAVPVEIISLDKPTSKGKFFEEGLSAKEYDFFLKTTSIGKVGGFLSKMSYNIKVDYRYLNASTSLITGTCNIRSEVEDPIFTFEVKVKSGGLYKCKSNEFTDKDFIFEVKVPPFEETGVSAFGVTISQDNTDKNKHASAEARMLYKGAEYSAHPTSYDASRTFSRIIDGYVIMQGDKLVGRIDFKGLSRNRGTLTVPVADADGREAVIFMGAQMLAMPELNSGAMRSQVMGGS